MSRLRFFFGEFHSGSINQTLHFLGFSLLGYSIAVENIWILLLSGVSMELGNIYNYFQGRHKKEFWETFLLRIWTWAFVAVGSYMIKIFLF